MKTKRILSILIAVLILLTQTTFAKDYSNYPQKFWDVSKKHWAYEYISELVDKNVISGYADGSFKPEETVSRAEWSKMLVVASGKQPITLDNNKSYAVDYNSNNWYYGYINSVVSYMNFYNDGGNYYFKPNQSVSREDVTVSLVKLKGYNVDNVDYSYISKFKDSNSISNELKKYIAVAIEKKLISGYEDNTFRGQDTLTRAEAATLLCRAFQLGNDNKTTNSDSVYLDGSNVNSNVNNETNKEESKNDSNGDSSDSENSSGNTIINNSNTTINNTTINNSGNGPVNVNNGTINNSSNTSKNEENNIKTPEDIEEDKLSYKIETLAKADIKNEHYDIGPINYIVKIDDIIYYYDSNNIIALDTISKKSNVVFNKNDEIIYNNESYKISDIKNLIYDSSNNKLVMYSDCISVNNITNNTKTSRFMIDVLNKEVIFKMSTAWYLADMVFEINGDNLWTYYYDVDNIGNISNSRRKYSSDGNGDLYYFYEKEVIGHPGYTFDMHDNGNDVYFIANDGIYKYDYSDFELFLETHFNSIAASDNGFIIRTAEGHFSFIDFEGAIHDYIPTTEIEIKDKKSIKSDFMLKMFINSKNELIVYDLTNKCFRIISENN